MSTTQRADPSIFNSLAIEKGKIGKNALVMWDAVAPCPQDANCKLYLDCPYLLNTDRKYPEKCTLQVKYIEHVFDALILRRQAQLNQSQLDQVGLLLMPLYGHLIKFKMLEHSLGHNITFLSNKGSLTMHPVYKEIRETLKYINFLSRQIGVVDIPVNVNKPNMDKLLQDGDPTYYESLFLDSDSPTASGAEGMGYNGKKLKRGFNGRLQRMRDTDYEPPEADPDLATESMIRTVTQRAPENASTRVLRQREQTGNRKKR